MERVLAWTLAWLLGVGLQLQQATLQPGGLQAGLVGAGGLLLAALVLRRGLRRAWVTALGALALVAIAFGSTDWRAAQRLAEALPAALEGQDLQVVGVVASLPQRSAAGTRFVFEVESAERLGQAVTVPRRLSLGWWYGDEDAPVGPVVTMVANDNWLEFTLRYVVDYRKRRIVKDQLFTRILEEVDKSGDRIRLASATFELVNMPRLDVDVAERRVTVAPKYVP